MLQINLKNIIEMINKRIKKGPIYSNSYLATIVKFKRVSLKLTLEELCANICSAAYCSKLERNCLDNPDETRVNGLCERMNLNYYQIMNLDTNDRIESMLYYFIEECPEAILNMEAKSIKDCYIAQDEIIMAYKAFITKDYKNFNFYINRLDTVKECLSDLELFALLIIVFRFYLDTLQYEKAAIYIDLIDHLNINKKKCALYVKECRFILACKTNSYNANLLLDELRHEFPSYSITKQFSFMIYFNETFFSEQTVKYLKDMGKDYVPKVYETEYHYALCLAITKSKEYIDAMDTIKEYETKDIRFATLFSYNLLKYKLKLKEEGLEDPTTDPIYKLYRQELVKKIKESDQNQGDTYHIAFLRLMQHELDDDKLDIICNYIKNQMLKELKDFTYPLYDEYIRDRYCELLGKLCRYKDAYLFLVENKNNLKK